MNPRFQKQDPIRRKLALLTFLALATGTLGWLSDEAQAEPELTLPQVVERTQQAYKETRDLTASFEQTYFFKVTGRSKKSAGNVYIKMPGKMRWDYLVPEKKNFVADGRTLWVISPADRQVLRQPVEQSDISGVLDFLMGSGDLQQRFELSLLGRDAAGRYRLKLVPRAGETHYRQVILALDPQTFRTSATEVMDPAGNLNQLVFRDLRVNQGLPDTGFAFQVPAGFRIIEGSAPAGPPPATPSASPDAATPSTAPSPSQP